MATKSHVIVGLDIGSNQITTIVGSLQDGALEPGVLGYGTAPSQGLRKGVVIDVEETVSAISASLETAERVAGVPLDRVTLSLNGSHISSLNSKGVIAVSRADGEITNDDIGRVIEAAQAVSIPTNREIIHVIPRVYTVDGQEGIKDPVGMHGVRLEAETHIITASSPIVKNLTKCVYQAGLNVDELVLAPLAASRATLSKRQRELGCVLIDIGGGTTGLTVFEEGDVLYTGILPVGSGHVTNDLAIGLRTSLEVAEKIKLEHGRARKAGASERDKIKLTEETTGEKVETDAKEVGGIIEARLEEIFHLVRAELKKVGRDALLPAGAILVGGGAKLDGIVELAKEELRLPAQIGIPTGLRGLVDVLEDPAYATAVGLLLWAADNREPSSGHRSRTEPISGSIGRARRLLRHFLP